MDVKELAKNIAENVNIFRMSDKGKLFSQNEMIRELRNSKCAYYVLTPSYLIKSEILKLYGTAKGGINKYVFAEKNKPVEHNVFFKMIDELRKKEHARSRGKSRILKPKETELKKNELAKFSTDKLINELVCTRKCSFDFCALSDIVRSLKIKIKQTQTRDLLLHQICEEFTDKELVEELRGRGATVKATIEL